MKELKNCQNSHCVIPEGLLPRITPELILSTSLEHKCVCVCNWLGQKFGRETYLFLEEFELLLEAGNFRRAHTEAI